MQCERPTVTKLDAQTKRKRPDRGLAGEGGRTQRVDTDRDRDRIGKGQIILRRVEKITPRRLETYLRTYPVQ